MCIPNYFISYLTFCLVIEATILVRDCDDISIEDKMIFFEDASQNFGRTALCVSGGASMSYFHFGVFKTLFEAKLLPNIIAGTSGGEFGCVIFLYLLFFRCFDCELDVCKNR